MLFQNPKNRTSILKTLFTKYLKSNGRILITVRTKKEIEKQNWKAYSDGYLTSTNTFQKGFTKEEIINLIKPFSTKYIFKKLSGGIVFLIFT